MGNLALVAAEHSEAASVNGKRYISMSETASYSKEQMKARGVWGDSPQ
jgi:hypothetical protein